MSGSVPLVTSNSISGIDGLEERPVYFVKLNGSANPNIVIKGEADSHDEMSDLDAEVSVKWGSKLMKHVNNKLVNTKIMAGPEIAEFKRAAAARFAAASPQYRNLSARYIWVKMPYVAGLTDADFFKKALVPGKDKPIKEVSMKVIKDNIKHFSDDTVWYQLGKIVAVDIFNGNSDRFDITKGQWQNLGNIMFVAAGDTKVIGLDTFDPNGAAQANLRRGGGYPELLTLTDGSRRHHFAEACVTSVGSKIKQELILSGCSPDTSFTIKMEGPDGGQILKVQAADLDRIFLPYIPNFEQGIKEGAQELQRHLLVKVQQYSQAHHHPAPIPAAAAAAASPAAPAWSAAGPRKTIPQGILDRMKYLRWLP